MKRPPRARIDGVLLLDKPAGCSSNDALVRVRRLLNAEKAGHGGTLDPLATGLLPILFGQATKFAHGLLGADKTYLAELVLGETTAGGDAEGEVLSRRPVTCDEAAVRIVCAAFVGLIEQVPPMHSAIKLDGRPLYALARAGMVVERRARRVFVHSIEVLSIAFPRVTLRVHCSKGTYIRSLAMDIGERLGCGAYLGALRREAVGVRLLDTPLVVASAVTLDVLAADDGAARLAHLLPFDCLLGHLPRLMLAPTEAARFANGQRIRLTPRSLVIANEPAPTVRVYDGARLLGLASLVDGLLAPQRLVTPALSLDCPVPSAVAPGPDRSLEEITT